MEIGLESINIRNIRVEKIEFLIGKHPQYLTECHIFAKMASLANMRLAHINSPQSDHCRQSHQLMSPNITSCMSDDINSNDLTSAHII